MTGWAGQVISGFAAPGNSQGLEAATGQPVAPAEQELHLQCCISLQQELSTGAEPSPQLAVPPPAVEFSVFLCLLLLLPFPLFLSLPLPLQRGAGGRSPALSTVKVTGE